MKTARDRLVFESNLVNKPITGCDSCWKCLKHMAICDDASSVFGLNTDICDPLNAKINQSDR